MEQQVRMVEQARMEEQALTEQRATALLPAQPPAEARRLLPRRAHPFLQRLPLPS
jgi:hypothetical protein